MKKNIKEYNVLFFLSSLGNGGLAVSIFIYLMFMISHPDTPMPIFEDVFKVLTSGNIVPVFFVAIALAGILYFSFRHFKILMWNIIEYRRYKETEAFARLKKSNGEVNLMVIPLTLGMSVNVTFVLGAVFIPGLWNVVEYLFPFALIAYWIVGIYALRTFFTYFSRIIVKGDFDFTTNNNLSQLIASFAFSMIAVGLAAPGAMSHNLVVSVIGIAGAIFFSIITILVFVIKFVLGFKSIFKYGITRDGAPSMWILIPIMTLLGITFVRGASGIHHNILHSEVSPVLMFIVLLALISVQIITGVLGYIVLNRTGYFKTVLKGREFHVGSYSLICPGVAFFVLGMFFIHWGLVKTHIIGMYSIGYFLLLLPLILVQLKTIQTLSKINRKFIESN